MLLFRSSLDERLSTRCSRSRLVLIFLPSFYSSPTRLYHGFGGEPRLMPKNDWGGLRSYRRPPAGRCLGGRPRVSRRLAGADSFATQATPAPRVSGGSVPAIRIQWRFLFPPLPVFRPLSSVCTAAAEHFRGPRPGAAADPTAPSHSSPFHRCRSRLARARFP